MRLVYQDKYMRDRPGLADIIAKTDADPTDITRINTLIQSMDAQNRQRLMRASGAVSATSPMENDLLDAANAGQDKAVDVPDYHQAASADDDLPWYQDVWNFLTKPWIEGADQPFGGESAQHAVGTALGEVAKVPGFVYRGVTNDFRSDAVQGQQAAIMRSQGYDPDNSFDMLAFQWNGGESTFTDLSPVRGKYGDADTDLAVKIFTGGHGEDALANYRFKIQDDFTNGKITAEQAADEIRRIEDPAFIDGALEMVNRYHTSIGRDLARGLLPDSWQDDARFTALSGTVDTIFTIFTDPTLVGGKAARTYNVAKWGLDRLDSPKIYTMLGLDDPVTGKVAPRAYQFAGNSRAQGIEDFIKTRAKWDAANAAGETDKAAGLYEYARMGHKDLMPVWQEMGGYRPAITVEERALAEKTGLKYTDSNGTTHEYGAVQTKPIRSLDDFADWAVNLNGLVRLANGLPTRETVLLPGRMGAIASARATRAMSRTVKGAEKARDRGDTLIDLTKIDELVGSPADDIAEREAELVAQMKQAGVERFEELNNLRGLKARVRAKHDAALRRVSTVLTEKREVSLHSSADAQFIRQWARIYLPKWEAARFASLWESGTPASRRTLLKGLMMETFEASGLTRSAVGRDFVDRYVNDLTSQQMRRYGFGKSDVIEEGYSGPRHGGLYPSQVQDTVVVPEFQEMRRLAAKAAMLGYDPVIANLGLNGKSLERVLLGLGNGRKIPRMGLSALRYALFSSVPMERVFHIVKMGWILNPANMARQVIDEYGGLGLRGATHRVRRGRQTNRDANLNYKLEEGRRFVALANSRIARAYRGGIRGIDDALTALARTKVEGLGKEWTEQKAVYAAELKDEMAQAEVFDALGARQYDNPVEAAGLGHEYAQEAHAKGVALERWEYKGHDEIPVHSRDQGVGLSALSNNYGQRFLAPRMLPRVKPESRDSILEWHTEKNVRLHDQDIADLRKQAHNKRASALKANKPERAEELKAQAERLDKRADRMEARGPVEPTRVTKEMADEWHAAHPDEPSPFVFRNAADSPANGVLGWMVWHKAIEDEEFAAKLFTDPDFSDTRWLLNQFYPDASLESRASEISPTLLDDVASGAEVEGVPLDMALALRQGRSAVKSLEDDLAAGKTVSVAEPQAAAAEPDMVIRAQSGVPLTKKRPADKLKPGDWVWVVKSEKPGEQGTHFTTARAHEEGEWQQVKSVRSWMHQEPKEHPQLAKPRRDFPAPYPMYEVTYESGAKSVSTEGLTYHVGTPKAAPAKATGKTEAQWRSVQDIRAGDTVLHEDVERRIRAISHRTERDADKPTADQSPERPPGSKWIVLDFEDDTRAFLPDNGSKSIRTVGQLQIDTPGSLARLQGALKTLGKGKLADEPAKRRTVIKLFQQGQRDLGIDLDDPAVKKVVDDTTRGSRDRFGQFMHNRWVSNNMRRENGAAATPAAPTVLGRRSLAERAVEAQVSEAKAKLAEVEKSIVQAHTDALSNKVGGNPPTKEDLYNYLRDDRFAAMRRELEVFNVDDAGKSLRADDAEGLDRAIKRVADKYLEDLAHMVTGRNGKMHPGLVDMLMRGEVPDVNALRAIGYDNLPPTAIKAQYGVAAENPVGGLVTGLTKVMNRGYDLVVTRPMQAFIRTPLYTDLYTVARGRTQRYADWLVDTHGWNRDIADDLAKNIARRDALHETLTYVDNPRVSSQFSAMSRGWWSFFRAQEDWFRRYGRAIKANPSSIRKAHMAIMGAEEAGILDRDEEGNLILTYPGSGALVESLLHVGHYIGWIDDSVLIPQVPDLRTRLTFLSPSLNNPFAYSTTPMVSIPMRFLAGVIPGDELVDNTLDRMVNGELGAGRSTWEQLLPPPILRLVQLNSYNGTTDGAMGSAMATAMTYMAMNGKLDDYADTNDDRARFLRDLQSTALTILAGRQVYALFAPGAPGMVEIGEDDDESSASFAYQDAGIRTMREEFNHMVATMGFGKAVQLWTELYPNKVAFQFASRTDVPAPQANTAATMDAAGYVNSNREFFTGKYRTIAPYFMPEKPGAFSQVAWNTMVELEVRQHKDLDTFFIDLVTANGKQAYYSKKDRYDNAIADATKAGDKARAAELRTAWDKEKGVLNAQYPTLNDWQAQGAARALERKDRINRLQTLVEDPDAPAQVQPQLAGAAQMLKVYREYETRSEAIKGQSSVRARSERQNLQVMYHDAMRQIVRRYPTMEDLYNGLFRLEVDEG